MGRKVHSRQAQGALECGPLKTVSRVSLAAGRHMFMACDMRNRIGLQQRRAQAGQALILRIFEALAL